MLSFPTLEQILPCVFREALEEGKGRDATWCEGQKTNEQEWKTQYVASNYCRRGEGNNISSSINSGGEGKGKGLKNT